MTAVRLRAAMLGAGALVVALEARIFQPRRLIVREVALRLPRWPDPLEGLRVALVADLHVGAPGVPLSAVSRMVRLVHAAQPDLILLLGDYFADVHGGRSLPPATVAAALAPLREVAPLAAVLGNHDWWAGGYRVRAAFEHAGITVLEESALGPSESKLPGGLWLAGVGDLWERSPDVAAALREVPAGAPVILLTHNPDVVLDVPGSVELTVAGHTHGGQVRAFGRPLHTISPITGNRLVRGYYNVTGRPLYISPGVGTSLLPLRFGAVPEVTMLRLYRDPRCRAP